MQKLIARKMEHHIYKLVMSSGHLHISKIYISTGEMQVSYLLHMIIHDLSIHIPLLIRTRMALFHSIRRPVCLGPDARDGPPRNGVKRPRPIGVGRSLETPNRLSPRDKTCPTFDSSTNQMVIQGVPSNAHSFAVSH